MSINSAIQTKQQQVAAVYTACNAKGATMPASANQNLANLASTIDTISQGTPHNQTIQKWIRTESGGVVTYSRDAENVGSITAITSDKFYGNTTLVSAIMPDTVVSINDNAFRDCTRLRYLNLDKVTNIGNAAFMGCGLKRLIAPSLLTISNSAFRQSSVETVEAMGNVQVLSYGAFWACMSLSSVVLPSSITTIGSYAFTEDSNLISVSGLDSVTSVGQEAFMRCSKFSMDLNLPNLTTLDSGAFGFTAITKVLSLGNVTGIGASAFRDCPHLTSAILPSSLTSMDWGVFYNCWGLTSLTVNATTPPALASEAIPNNSNLVIYVPSASVSAYQSASGWSAYASKIQAIP